jgi:N-acetylglucosaminyl-diphospho-decaprenol L-rhamnosyltransferase
VYVPTAVVEHSGGHATKRVPRMMLRAHHSSAYRYLARRYAGTRFAPLRLVLGLGLLARYLLSLASRRTAEGAAPTRSASALIGGHESSGSGGTAAQG